MQFHHPIAVIERSKKCVKPPPPYYHWIGFVGTISRKPWFLPLKSIKYRGFL
jgi:hypothetical protein